MERRMAEDQDIVPYLSDVNSSLRELLDEKFVGLHLHGSLTMAAFQPTESDIDVIVTVDWSLNDTMRDNLRNEVGSVPLPEAASGLDLSLLSTDVARHLTEDARWEVTSQVSRTLSGQEARSESAPIHSSLSMWRSCDSMESHWLDRALSRASPLLPQD
jgi:hypothetical protein